LDNPPDNWGGEKGFVSKEMMERRLPKPSNDLLVLMCGPPPMMGGCKKALNELGYKNVEMF